MPQRGSPNGGGRATDAGRPKGSQAYLRHATRRLRITHGLLTAFLLASSVVAALAAATVLYPHGVLVSIWSAKEAAYHQLLAMRRLAGGGFAALFVFLAITTVGWLRCRRWAWFLLSIGLAANLVSDVARAATTRQWVDLLGVPIEGSILLWLTSRRIRREYLQLNAQKPDR